MGFVESNGNGMYMPVAPAGGYGYNNGDLFGGSGAWAILFLFAAMWGGFGGGWGGNGFDGGAFPWLITSNNNLSNQMQEGFNSVQTSSQLSDIRNAISSGFSNMEVNACNRAMDSIMVEYNNQIADMNQRFSMQQSFDQCYCENRLATCQTQNLITRESGETRDVILKAVQTVLDKLCQDKIDSKNEQIANLQNQLNMATLAASQTAQTAQLLAAIQGITPARTAASGS